MHTTSSSASASAARPYTQRLGAIRDDQFQAALDRFDLGAFRAAEPITRGMFGQNVFLTSTAGEFVLRGSPHDARQFPRERFFARHLHERTAVPAPWPYRVDPDEGIFGWSYAIMPRMHGIHLDDTVRAGLTTADRTAIATAMGATLAGFGAATFDACGPHDAATDAIAAIPDGTVGERRRTIEHLLDDAMRYCPETIEPDRAWIDGIIARGLDAESRPYQPTATTSDFGENNVVVERAADGWRCTGVFDFMEYSAGDLEAAIIRPALGYAEKDQALGRAFLAAFAAVRPLRSGAMERFALATLADRLIFWNFGHGDAKWFPAGQNVRVYVEPAIAQAQALIEGLPAAD